MRFRHLQWTKLFGLWLCCWWPAIAASPGVRHKRFAMTGCTVSPDMDMNKVADEGQTITISCSFDSPPNFCVWSHNDPNRADVYSGNSDVSCNSGSGSSSSSSQTCMAHPRITMQHTSSQCSISISSSKPEDTGKWNLIAVEVKGTNSPQSQMRELEVFTFNRSRIMLLDRTGARELHDLDANYNYDTKEKTWIKGTRGYDQVEVRCEATGRPLPALEWSMANNDRDLLNKASGFEVKESESQHSRFISKKESIIKFAIDDNLLTRLRQNGINTNPSDGLISFELQCRGSQANTYEASKVRINVRRMYDDGKLRASTIGLIVGLILAVIVIVIVVGLLVFAKGSKRWCFSEDPEPREQRRQQAGISRISQPRGQISNEAQAADGVAPMQPEAEDLWRNTVLPDTRVQQQSAPPVLPVKSAQVRAEFQRSTSRSSSHGAPSGGHRGAQQGYSYHLPNDPYRQAGAGAVAQHHLR